MKHETAKAIASAAGFDLYQYDGSRTCSREAIAERLTAGRTHYFDEGTRRYFGSRVLRLRTHCAGLILGAVESSKGDFEGSFRVYRPVFIAIDGTVIAKPNIEDSARNAAGAEKQYSAILATLTDESVAADILQRAERNARRTLDAIKTARRAMRAKNA